MKNVVIHKLVKYIFTEGQLKGYWQRLGNDLSFESLTSEQLMKLAKKLLNNSSSSQLEEHMVGGEWRTEDEAEGKLLSEDDSEKSVHVELIDTDQPGIKKEVLLVDRLLKVECDNCHYSFYARDLNTDVKSLNCPSCKNQLGDV